jgi:hypothetical protein
VIPTPPDRYETVLLQNSADRTASPIPGFRKIACHRGVWAWVSLLVLRAVVEPWSV